MQVLRRRNRPSLPHDALVQRLEQARYLNGNAREDEKNTHTEAKEQRSPSTEREREHTMREKHTPSHRATQSKCRERARGKNNNNHPARAAQSKHRGGCVREAVAEAQRKRDDTKRERETCS